MPHSLLLQNHKTQMPLIPFLLLQLFSAIAADSCNFLQTIEIDTTKRLLQMTPEYTTVTALEAHRKIEKELKTGKYDLIHDFYLLFRYRDKEMVRIWSEIIVDNPENDLFQLWFINALEQMGNKNYLRLIVSFRDSENAIIREYVANSYGFLGSMEDLKTLQNWHDRESNCYVRKTILASMAAIKNGGYKSKIPYLPKYYDQKPLKIQFLFNKSVNDDPHYRFDLVDTSAAMVDCTSFCFPHQQYLWRLRNAPRRGTFGSKTKNIYHIGNDSGWLLEGLPVHAVCDGMVKQISHNVSWGTLVVIESGNRKAADTLCTIYGHLSPFLDVNAVDTIHERDKIGQIGNSATFDNGGYWAHLHFGIEKKSFWRAQIVGYDKDTLSCENPVEFIARNMKDESKTMRN